MLAPPLRANLIELEHLLNGESYDAGSVVGDPVLNRIRQIMIARNQGADTGIADLAALIRHALLSHADMPRRPRECIRSFPQVANWERFGLSATDLGRSIVLEAPTPATDWLLAYGDGAD